MMLLNMSSPHIYCQNLKGVKSMFKILPNQKLAREPIYLLANSKTFKNLQSTAATSVVAEKRVIRDDIKLIQRHLNLVDK